MILIHVLQFTKIVFKERLNSIRPDKEQENYLPSTSLFLLGLQIQAIAIKQ